MSNTNLTPDEITRAALVVLHQKLTFLSGINMAYDDSFAQTGAKIGSSLRVRLPDQYVVRSGKVMDVQDVTEDSVTLNVQSQKGIDTSWTSEELTMDIDDFSQRKLDPAMSQLAATIEADVLQTVTKDVNQLVDNDGSAIDFDNVLEAGEKMNDSLAPVANRRCLLSTRHNRALVNALKGLFNDQQTLSGQYVEGVMGRTAGFEFAWSTHAVDHTTGTAAEGDTSYTVDGATEDGSTITVADGTTTFLEGDVITIVGLNSVHPETKVDTGKLQQFVITADSGSSATSLSISPAIVASGARQNVTGFPDNDAAIHKIGAGNGEKLNGSLAYHKDAFTFATADLIMPRGTDMASRQVLEGISMRLVRDFDIKNDEFPVRFDVLYGFKTLRPQLACRIHADG